MSSAQNQTPLEVTTVKGEPISFEIKPTDVNSSDFTFELNLPVSLENAWKLWTDSKQLEKWLTTKAKVQAEVGGPFELFWDPENPSENSTLGCKIIALAPRRLLSFQWRGPVPYADLMNFEPFPTWVSISFESVATEETVIHFRHSGWGKSARWNEAREWQNKAWIGAFAELENIVRKNEVKNE